MSFDWDQCTVRINSAGYSCWRMGRKFSNNWKQRILTDQDLWIICDGHGRIELSDMDAELGSGRMVWMRPGHFYEVEQDPDHPLKLYWFHFDLLDRKNRFLFPSIQVIPEYFHSPNGMHAMLLARTLFRLFKKMRGKNDPSKVSYLQQLLKSVLMLIESEAGGPDLTAVPHSDIAEDAAQYSDGKRPRHLSLSKDFVTQYCYSEDERLQAIDDLGPEPEITRFKGLGEISPEEFRNFIGPDIRLDQVTLHKSDQVAELLNFYMGDNTMDRQNFIIDNLVIEEDLAEESPLP